MHANSGNKCQTRATAARTASSSSERMPWKSGNRTIARRTRSDTAFVQAHRRAVELNGLTLLVSAAVLVVGGICLAPLYTIITLSLVGAVFNIGFIVYVGIRLCRENSKLMIPAL